MFKAMFAIALGSAVGGLLRWALGLRLNAVFESVPLGTLSANVIAGYVVGLAMAFFAQAPGLSPEWRLLIITGFCGGLSTFSTFSAEVVGLLEAVLQVRIQGTRWEGGQWGSAQAGVVLTWWHQWVDVLLAPSIDVLVAPLGLLLMLPNPRLAAAIHHSRSGPTRPPRCASTR